MPTTATVFGGTAAAATTGIVAGGGVAAGTKDKVVGAGERDVASKGVVPREKGTGSRKKGRPRKATGLAGEHLLIHPGRRANMLEFYDKALV